MTEEEIIYEEARKERRTAEQDAETKLEEAITFARRQYRIAVADALRVHKLRVSQTRNPHCHVCHLYVTRGRCNCTYKCPSTLCKGEE